MPQILQIIEVLQTSTQGNTGPVLCRAEDGFAYYVKGRQTNRSSLWAEWICACLGRAMGLPLPPFSLLQLDEALLRELPADLQQIGTLPAFGSRRHETALWFEPGFIYLADQDVRRDLLVFDWWVRNADRTRGNPNLLWDAPRRELVVIDHNLAFDPAFDTHGFPDDHIFGAAWAALVSDLVTQAHYAGRLTALLPVARQAITDAPPEWLWENDELDVPTRFDPEAALALLERCQTPELWRTV